ncbi:MAG: molybdopterin-dependent oxidoreductase [Thermoanaerobaculia bacterium]|nr:molybdopterin-dependent oxidoreductase [Thermoanaerobaculia bacterium]
MTTSLNLDRREFVKLLGGGIVVLLTTSPSELFAQQRQYPTDVNAYLHIAPDGRITVFSGKIEMGQGVMTSQAQMAAEELGVSLGRIEMILGDTDKCPWDMGTFGSLTTRMFGPALRAACAEARLILMQLASEKLGVPREQLVVDDGIVSVKGDASRKLTYGQLAKGQAITRTLDEKAVLRSVAEFKVMGRSPKRMDGVEKVTGRAKYAADITLPGMLSARILRPPAHGAKLVSVDTARAEKVEGLTLVNQDGLVAVLHADPETAGQALQTIVAKWEVRKVDVDQDSIFDYLVKKAPEPDVRDTRGDLAAARKDAAKLFELTWRSGYKAHAPIEPHAALAEVKDGKATVWAATQTPFPTRDAVASAIGFDPANVRLITPYVGGGFGGKSSAPQAVEAARLAKIVGKPVQVEWTREEEFFYDTFDPAAVVKIASAVDAEGRITLWEYDVYFAGARSTEVFYDAPNARVRVFGAWRGAGADTHLFAVGPWRAPGANTNVFARESQIDVMAAAAGIDPLEFRLRNTKDERMRRVLKAAAGAAGWKAAPGPSGQGRAIACGIDAGTYAALVAFVKVDEATGTVKVERVVCAQDMGVVVNPDGATMQVEGCITMGLGYVFSEELRFEGGKILDKNFDSYKLPLFSWVPKIETVLVKNDELAPQGGGEPAIVPMGAVIANAVFDACGARVDRLPMTPERLLAAIRAPKAKEPAAG